jgi:hypothetical protein
MVFANPKMPNMFSDVGETRNAGITIFFRVAGSPDEPHETSFAGDRYGGREPG